MRVFLFLGIVVNVLGASTTIFSTNTDTTPETVQNCVKSECVPIFNCLINDGEIQDSCTCSRPDVSCCYTRLSSSEPTFTTEELTSSSQKSTYEPSSLKPIAISKDTTVDLGSTPNIEPSEPTSSISMSLFTSTFLSEESTSVPSTESSSTKITLITETTTASQSTLSTEPTSPTQSSSISTSTESTSLSDESTSVFSSEETTLITDETSTELDSTLSSSIESSELTSPASSFSIFSSDQSTFVPSSTSSLEESKFENTTVQAVETTTETSIPFTESTASKILSTSLFVDEAYEADCGIWACLLEDQCNEPESTKGSNLDHCPEPYIKCCFFDY